MHHRPLNMFNLKVDIRYITILHNTHVQKSEANNYYLTTFCHQILTLSERGKESQDERQGKMLLHTEYSLLSLLHNQPGVVHHHGLFQVCERGCFVSFVTKQPLCCLI